MRFGWRCLVRMQQQGTTAAPTAAGPAAAGHLQQQLHQQPSLPGQPLAAVVQIQQLAEGLAEWLATLDPEAIADGLHLAVQFGEQLQLQLVQRSCSSSSGSSSSTASNSATAAPVDQAELKSLDNALEHVEGCLAELDILTSNAAAVQEAKGLGGLLLRKHMQGAWQQHLPAIWLFSEGYLRWHGRLPAVLQAEHPYQVGMPAVAVCLQMPAEGNPSVLAEAMALMGAAVNEQLWSLMTTSVKHLCMLHASNATFETNIDLRATVQEVVDILVFGNGGEGALRLQVVVPWLTLCGRSLQLLSLDVATQLRVSAPGTSRLDKLVGSLSDGEMRLLVCQPHTGPDGEQSSTSNTNSSQHQQQQQQQQQEQREDGQAVDDSEYSDHFLLRSIISFLQDSRVSAQLSAAGYDVATPLNTLRDADTLMWLLPDFTQLKNLEMSGQPAAAVGVRLLSRLQRCIPPPYKSSRRCLFGCWGWQHSS